jgi:hypothetical protein
VKLNSGKLVILGIVSAAIAAAVVAWWHQYQQGRRALEYWGAAGARLIRTAPEVELLQLAGAENAAATENVIDRREITQARGLVHARQALISDPSFRWDEKPLATPDWEYAIVFRDGRQEFTVLVSPKRAWAAEEGKRAVRLSPTFAQGLSTFFEEQFASR